MILMARHVPLPGVVIVVFIGILIAWGTLLISVIEFPNSVPTCGFRLPGRSAIWQRQLASCRSASGSVSWPTYQGGPVLDMHPYAEALRNLELSQSSVPVADDSDTALHLHAHMVPHIRRSVPELDQPMFNTSVLVRRAGELSGNKRSYSAGYMSEYHGGPDHRLSLAEFLSFQRRQHETNKSQEHYWLGCLNPNHKAGNDSGIDASARLWAFDAGKVLLARPPVPGIRLPVSLCLRLATQPARLRMHHDSMHNVLYQLHGSRRLLLMMPDIGLATQYSFKQQSDTDRQATGQAVNSAVVAAIDPRSVNYTNHPKAAAAHMLTAVLNPGDALFIPAMWWHYVEVIPDSSPLRTGEMLSVALNAFIGGSQFFQTNKSVIAHPCDPAGWSSLQHIRYFVLESIRDVCNSLSPYFS